MQQHGHILQIPFPAAAQYQSARSYPTKATVNRQLCSPSRQPTSDCFYSPSRSSSARRSAYDANAHDSTAFSNYNRSSHPQSTYNNQQLQMPPSTGFAGSRSVSPSPLQAWRQIPPQPSDHTIDTYQEYPPRPSSPQRSPQSPVIGKQAARSNSPSPLGPTTLMSTDGHPSMHRSMSPTAAALRSELETQAKQAITASTNPTTDLNTQLDARAEIHQLIFRSPPKAPSGGQPPQESRPPPASSVLHCSRPAAARQSGSEALRRELLASSAPTAASCGQQSSELKNWNTQSPVKHEVEALRAQVHSERLISESLRTAAEEEKQRYRELESAMEELKLKLEPEGNMARSRAGLEHMQQQVQPRQMSPDLCSRKGATEQLGYHSSGQPCCGACQGMLGAELLVPSRGRLVCDVCNDVVPPRTVFRGCKRCDYDVCAKCLRSSSPWRQRGGSIDAAVFSGEENRSDFLFMGYEQQRRVVDDVDFSRKNGAQSCW